MKDPRRWVELSSDEFERDLLRSSRRDVGSEHAYQRTLASLGVGVLMPLAAAQVAEGAAAVAALTGAPAKSLGAAVLLKWLGSGMLLGVVTASGIGLSSRVGQQEARVQVAVAVASAAVPMRRAPNVVASSAVVVLEAPSIARPERTANSSGRGGARVPEPIVATPASSATALPAPRAQVGDPSPPDTNSLQREMRLLDAARRALAREAAAEALTTLRVYAAEFEHGSLVPEARVLEVRALLAAGERERATALGARIIAANPQGRHADAVRALLERRSNP
jgi:hypothetical protein